MVKFEDALKEEAENSRSKGFVSENKISLNYKLITSIAPMRSLVYVEKFKGIKKLYLSHNNLRSLEGLDYFDKLTHLSVSYNKIYDIEELDHVANQYSLINLSIAGNFFDKHPD